MTPSKHEFRWADGVRTREFAKDIELVHGVENRVVVRSWRRAELKLSAFWARHEPRIGVFDWDEQGFWKETTCEK